MMMAFARKPLGYERGLAATIFLLFACPCSHFTFFFALTMGKRGKRRRRSKNSKHKNTHNASESTVTITGNENSTVKPWKSDIFSAPPSDEILTNFQQRWRRSLTPTDIQLHVWPMWMYSNKNIVGIAPTNSGKTLSYALPLAENDGNSIVLVPTRELARQVERELISVVSIDKIIVCIYGGVDRDAQVQALTKAVESDKPWIVTATTGRLVDVLNNESLPSLRVNSIVLDEADRMASNAEMAKQVDDILQQFQVASSKSIRVCLFSATSPVNVQDKWNEWIGEESVCIKVNTATIGETPVVSSEQKETNALETTTSSATQSDVVASKTATKQLDYSKIPAHVNQILHVCAAHKKPRKLMTTLQKIRKDKGRRKGLCLVFFARIKTLQYVSKLLNQEGYKAAEFHSQMAQSMRERTLMNFKSGKMPTLLATDIAARGIHVNNIDYIINYDFPGTLDQYVHRCGRAGRNRSSSATVYSFFTRDFAPMANDVVALLETSDAWIDPNLVELVSGTEARPKKKQRQEETRQSYTTEKELPNNSTSQNAAVDNSDDEWDDGQFANLNANRIVLQRAGHVSDASESESEGEGSS